MFRNINSHIHHSSLHETTIRDRACGASPKVTLLAAATASECSTVQAFPGATGERSQDYARAVVTSFFPSSLSLSLCLSPCKRVGCYFSKSLLLEVLCTALWTRFPSTFTSRPFLPRARSAHRLARLVGASHSRDLIIATTREATCLPLP